MIEYARQNMCDFYLSPAQPAPARLDDFNVFKKGNATFTYGNLYPYEMYPEVEDASNVYYNLINFRDYRPETDSWKSKVVEDWNSDETVAWIYDCAITTHGFNELDVPFHNFRISGHELKNKRREEIVDMMLHPHVDNEMSRRIAYTVFDRLHCRLSEEIRQQSVLRYPEQQTFLDLDCHGNRGYHSDYKPNDISLMSAADSGDDHEDVFRIEPASPACSYGSDGSKSGDEDDKKKPFKRPPGRPKGSIKKDKRPRSVSVPQFLRDLLLDERFCPSIIKWEDHSQGKFRFVKPDEVAKLWGQMKQNDNMTFEKFSRAMRYHYQHMVLVSVPTARLVYQFGPKGPDFKTNNPNFVKVKSELENPSYS
ncbi:ETS-related transcription factor Elf-3 [Bicyclus anynana]|uniref:ETS-related transcription factor Elf-3 n=1 Tax=Bicyclus anynana TaxID=110368 RepID=A0A6J1NZV5_BICAN|nr:ETS-related transcription factor Elf-3 [Bicyclus anynana]